MLVIFDLDQTIIDTSIAKEARDIRNWSLVYTLISQFRLYDGIADMFSDISVLKINTAIVTSSPRSYYERVVSHFGIHTDVSICYHDTRKHKPYPDPILAAMALSHANNTEPVLCLGDDMNDMLASRAAGIIPIACLWGSQNKAELLKSSAKYICRSVSEAHSIIRRYCQKSRELT